MVTGGQVLFAVSLREEARELVTVTGGDDGSWHLEGLVFVRKRNSVGVCPKRP